jgi:hypothetical protein
MPAAYQEKLYNSPMTATEENQADPAPYGYPHQEIAEALLPS